MLAKHGDLCVLLTSQVQQFKIVQFVQEACELGHLCVTVPWVVEYLSMMDPQATMIDHYCTLLHTLMDIYRYDDLVH